MPHTRRRSARLPHTVCYAVKANSSLAVLALLAKAGAGFDIVSGGELYRVLQAGGDPVEDRLFRRRQNRRGSGIRAGKRHPQLQLRIGGRTRADRRQGRAPRQDRPASRSASIRTWTPSRIPTFPPDSASTNSASPSPARPAVYERARQFRNLLAEGVSCHIGSQILDPSPILEAVDKVLALANTLRAQGHPIRHARSGRRPRRGLPHGGEIAGDPRLRGDALAAACTPAVFPS